MGITDLEEQFTFYAAYHHTTMNKLIHIFCVWPILWTTLVLTEYIPLEVPATLTSSLGFFHPINVTVVVSLFYVAVYLSMDQKAGALAAVMILLSLITARQFFNAGVTSGGMPVWLFATIVHVGCWIAQFIGHGVFEGRAPALFDSLYQAAVMAPLFVLLEVLFMLGYRKSFQKKMWARVDREIAKFKSSKKSATKK